MKRILCYGDSNTYGADPEGGSRFDETTRYPKVLASLLGAEYEVIEEGLPGRTTVYETFVDPFVNGRTYLYPCLLSHWPLDLVTIMLGTNDLSTGSRVNAYYAAAGAERLVNLIRQVSMEQQLRCPQILLISPPLIAETTNSPVIENVFSLPAAAWESRHFKRHFSDVAGARNCAFLAAEDYTQTGSDGVHITKESHKNLAIALHKAILNCIETETA